MFSAFILLTTPVLAVDPLLTFGFTDLDGGFDAGISKFTADASAWSLFGPYDTAGNVTRILPTGGWADFDAGFSDGPYADFNLWMDLLNITATAADANGEFTITDYDGDTITGDITGEWSRIGGISFFTGSLSDVRFLETGGGNTFDGVAGSGFSTADLSANGIDPFDGAMGLLRTGSWFDSAEDVTHSNTMAQGVIVPEPATVLLLILAGGVRLSRWRRRRLKK